MSGFRRVIMRVNIFTRQNQNLKKNWLNYHRFRLALCHQMMKDYPQLLRARGTQPTTYYLDGRFMALPERIASILVAERSENPVRHCRLFQTDWIMRERQIAYGLTRIFTSLSMTFVLGWYEGLIGQYVWHQQCFIICPHRYQSIFAPKLCVPLNPPAKPHSAVNRHLFL